VTGTWITTRDAHETRVAAGPGNGAAPPAGNPPKSDQPGTAAGPSSTTTGPQPSRSGPTITTQPAHGSSPTTSGTGSAVTSPTPTTTSITTPLDPYCGVPVAPASEPAPDTTAGWTSIPAAPIAPRMRHGAVWTGREMIVWGGSNGDYNGWQQFNDGAAFNPSTGTWRVLPPAPLKGRTFPVMVWTGREMVIVGGGTLDGAAYDPVKNCWRTIADAPVEVASPWGITTAWTGDEVLVWNATTGALWDPATDTWRQISAPPGPAECGKFGAGAGKRLYIWWRADGVCGTAGPTAGAAYDPATDTWAPTPIGQNITLAGPRPPSLWTGAQLLLNGVTDEASPKTAWFAFDPNTGTWRTVPQPSYVVPGESVVWSGAEMLLWGGIPGGGGLADIAAYDPIQNQWRIAGRSPFTGRADHTAVWTGTQMLIWGGQGDKLAYGDGGGFRPA